MPVIRATPQTSTRIDEVSDTITYVGTGPVGAADADTVWAIKRLETVGTVTDVKWAGGGIADQKWSDRATLIYA